MLIKPSKAAIGRVRERLGTEMRSLRGANAAAVLIRLNPIIRGWAAYYRGVVSSEAFSSLDHHTWKLTYKWACFRHPNKSRRWIIAQYFGTFNRSRRDRWVFGDRQSGGYLHRFGWTRIVRHQMVKGAASPDDPSLTDYWTWRRRKAPPPPTARTTLRLLEAQDGRCALCGDWLLPADDPPQTPREWELRRALSVKTTMTVTMRRPGTSDNPKPRLIHAHCQQRLSAADGDGTALLDACEPGGLA